MDKQSYWQKPHHWLGIISLASLVLAIVFLFIYALVSFWLFLFGLITWYWARRIFKKDLAAAEEKKEQNQ